jgi:beta-N-acetylhexosaminidase
VVDRFGAGEAVKRAVAAGNDVLLMPADVRGAVDAVLAGIGEGRYDQARIDRSVRRVLELKRRFGLPGQRLVSLDAIRGIVGDPANVASAQMLADRSFTLVRDASGTVPLEVRASRPRVLSVTYARRADLGAGVAFDAQLGERVDLRKAFVNADDARPNIDRMVEDAAPADVVVIGSYVNVTSESASAEAPTPLVDLVNRFSDRGARVILVSFGSPYVIAQAPRAGAYAIAWGGTAASQRAAARALVGSIPIGGRLPITIPGIAALGTGETRPARP